ncbi:hypothetical protein SSU98_0175 [Streptococcus suis 98HAH33]|nr:hypothetical protein SSU05_0173 [Streptococcus suis 05ZYH33]ABP91335.1 hypothetical protein SSU98_0175 [Streptococcus suis 98HAH33]
MFDGPSETTVASLFLGPAIGWVYFMQKVHQ